MFFVIPTDCFKNPSNPSCIDLILTNAPRSFQNSCAIETGLSDCHKMTITVMKATFEKLPPKVIKYRDYRKFSNEKYQKDLLEELSKATRRYDEEGLRDFLTSCTDTLDKHAPQKQITVRGNQSPFMNKEVSKAIMERSRLKNKFLRVKSEENKMLYKKQRNYCVSLVKKTKREYYSNLKIKDVTDNKKFWKTVKPFLSDKGVTIERITLVENDEVLESDERASEVMNDFFTHAVSNLNIAKYKDYDPLAENISDKTIKAIVKYRNHPSILAIQKKGGGSSFSFSHVEIEDMEKEIRNLDPSKSAQGSDIPTKVIKENCDIFAQFLTNCFNKSVDTSKFPTDLKLAEVKPAHKKGAKSEKENFRPLSILPNISKLFEKYLFKQITSFLENKLFCE